MKNVSELLLSLIHHVTPIEVIEDDSFISTAFVDKIFLEAIPARQLAKNAFRGLSFCKNILLTNSYIEEIQPNAFYRANNIENLNLSNSRLKFINPDSFKGMFNVQTIDLRGNYIKKLNKSIFEPILEINLNNSNEIHINSSLTLIDLRSNNYFIVKKFLFEKNPIECDCSLIWLLNNKLYRNYVNLPEICAGPKGLDCIRINDLNTDSFECKNDDPIPIRIDFPCDDLEFDIEKNQSDKEIISISASKGKKKTIDYEDEETLEEYEEDVNNGNFDDVNTEENLPNNINQDIKSLFVNSNPSIIMTTSEVVKATSAVYNEISKNKDLIVNYFSTTTGKSELRISKPILASTSKLIPFTTPHIPKTTIALKTKILTTDSIQPEESSPSSPISSPPPLDNQFNNLLPSSGSKMFIDNQFFLIITLNLCLIFSKNDCIFISLN